MRKPRKTSYHHGRLREALLAAALDLVSEQGAAAVSLREVARRAGVSHAAPAHHFGDKAGLLTALATEGFRRFTDAQRAGAARGGDDPQRRFAWLGWAYVMFAAEHRAHFEVMFRPELLRKGDAELTQVSRAAYEVLLETARAALGDPAPDQLALQATTSWAKAHGLATLWVDGNLANIAIAPPRSAGAMPPIAIAPPRSAGAMPLQAGLSDLDALARKVFGLPAAEP